MAAPYFTPALFRFLRELRANNDRDWFLANKERFERDLKEPALRFIVDFGAPLQRISPHFRADPRPSGGSLFRIYRDVRFSKDKNPYKTHAGLHFRHEAGKTAHTPGFYLHLEPGDCLVGVGLWRPDTPTLQRIRGYVLAHPERWRAAVEDPAFARRFIVSGERLKRPPQGVPADHPLVEVLKLKDFTAYVPLTQRQVTAPGFPEECAELFRAGGALVRFVCEALDQPY